MKIPLGKYRQLEFSKWLLVIIGVLILIGVGIHLTGGDLYVSIFIPFSLLFLSLASSQRSRIERQNAEQEIKEEDERLKRLIKEVINEK